MPIYEFLCKDCRREFKTLRSADRVAEVACPTCGTSHLARLLSVTAQTHSSAPSEGACALPMGGG